MPSLAARWRIASTMWPAARAIFGFNPSVSLLVDLAAVTRATPSVSALATNPEELADPTLLSVAAA
jgi:hypothetical protein